MTARATPVALRALPCDPLLPHLRLALDGDAMAEVFSRWTGRPVRQCRVEHTKYRPRRNLSVAYRVALEGTPADDAGQLVSTRWCHGGDAARRHAKAQAAGGTAQTPSPVHDPRLDVVARWWPHDPHLGAAAAVLQRLQAHDLLDVSRATRRGAVPRQVDAVQLVQVVPERRLTACVHWTGADGRPQRAYAKADAQGRAATTQALLQQLWSSPARRRGDLLVPQPLGWHAGSGLQWQSAVPGRSLREQGRSTDAATAARVGALLAALHASGTPQVAGGALQALRQAVTEAADVVGLAAPEHAPAARALAAALLPGVSELALAPHVLLHGDLHPGNLLRADDGTLGLVDLDSAGIGPLPLDLGAWLADGASRAVLAGTDPGHTLPAARAFAEAHALAWGHRPSEARLAWALACQLLCQRVLRCAVNLKPGAYEGIGPLLALAQRLLQRGHLDALAAPAGCAPVSGAAR